MVLLDDALASYKNRRKKEEGKGYILFFFFNPLLIFNKKC